MHCICLSWIHPFVSLLLCFSLWYLTLDKKLQAFRGRMTKQYHDLIQYAFEQTLLMMYRHFFQFPNTGVIRKLIPSQPLRAKEVGVFCFKTIKTLDINLGQGSISVNPRENAHWGRKLSVRNTTNDVERKKKAFLWNQKTRVVPYHIDSQSLKREKPTKPKPIKEA